MSYLMSTFTYEAVNPEGLTIKGALEVASQSQALRRIKEMGLFPTRVAERRQHATPRIAVRSRSVSHSRLGFLSMNISPGRVRTKSLAVFTRQLATLINAGMPLLRGLRLLQVQETHQTLKRIIGELSAKIEGGCLMSEALEAHSRTFSRLYVNMVKAGELSGSLDLALQRLAEFMEKTQRIKAKVRSAMFYPTSVMFVATVILSVMLIYVIPKFKQVFEDLIPGASLPAFTTFVLQISDAIKEHALACLVTLTAAGVVLALGLRTGWGRRSFDRFKLTIPAIGPVFRNAAISRFARTFGTLLSSGVPVLQALNIVKETAANVIVRGVIHEVHNDVKEGGTIAAKLKVSKVFPPVIAGMVDVGEQTGALPDMLLKIADNCDEDVDNSVSAMTSLLEPFLIVFLAVVVGSIVIAMFLPILVIINNGVGGSGGGDGYGDM